MMRHLTFVAIALLLWGCQPKNKVNLIHTNASGEVPALGNLVFQFDKKMVGDTLVGQWLDEDYIAFEPPIAGSYRWESEFELVFSPQSDLPPATSFRARLNNSVLKHTDGLRFGHVDIAEFHTPYVVLENLAALWNTHNGSVSSAFAQAEVLFNYTVTTEAFKEFVRFTIDNKPVSYNLQTTETDSRMVVSLSDVKAEDKDAEVRVLIKKGFTPHRGKSGTASELQLSTMLLSPFRVQVTDVEANHDGTQGTLKVRLSQEPVAENIQSFIDISPALNYTVEVQAGSLLIRSNEFSPARSYTLQLKAGLKGKIGGSLKEAYQNTVAFGQLEPSVRFVNRKAVYLASKGERLFEAEITSVSKVKVIISKIYENNLLAAQRYGYYPTDNRSYDYEEDYDYYDEGSYYNEEIEWGDVIYEQVIETKNLPQHGNSRLLKFDVQDKLRDYKGIYHIKIRSMEDYWRNDSRFVALTDIGLITKQAKDKLWVFANSIKTTESLGGVALNVYGINNQLIATAVTGQDGVAEISVKNKDLAGFKPAMITARMGNDYNYLPLNTTRVETSRFDVGGKRSNPTGLDAYIYFERDIYRPGEKMNASVILRNWRWGNPGEVPVKVKVLLPNGKELKAIKKVLNSEGSIEAQAELSSAAVTGSYTVEVYTANDVLLASRPFLVEEFMPDRIRLEATTDKKQVKPGDNIQLNVLATNFFGPPAGGRSYEVEMQVKEQAFAPVRYTSYDFGLANQDNYYEKVVREGSTAENGTFTETFTLPATYSNRGLLKADFYSTVFDETGRPVNRKSTVEILSQDVFYGIGSEGYYYYPLNQTVSFPLIALTRDEKALSDVKARVMVIKREYNTYLSRSYSYFRYESRREDKTLIDQEVTINGENTRFNFVPRTPGEYFIRVSKPGTGTYVENSFYSYGSWGSSGGNFEVNNKGNIDISADKQQYKPGEQAKLLFKAPFNGKLLVTVEAAGVMEHHYVKVEKRSASLNINIRPDFLPNVYVSATLIKPHQNSDMPLTVAYGYHSLKVEEPSTKIPVTIVAAKSVRSNSRQKVVIKAQPDCNVTLAAVDEGILQVTDYKTPDPHGHYYAKRALEISSSDLYPLLFPEVSVQLSKTGGDGFDLSKRTNPLQNKRVKLLSYWSGIAQTNSKGEAQFEFDIPAFNGEVRLMAVAYKANRFGSSSQAMTVADPVVMSVALPRFLSPGDTVEMPVTITNTTTKNASADIQVTATGPVKIIGAARQSAGIASKKENRATFYVTAAPQMGEASVTVKVNALGEQFNDVTDITVRPPASLQKVTGSGVVQAGKSVVVSMGNNNFIPKSTDYKFVVSKNPVVEIVDQLYYLLRYPHGCTEQTISTAFPQLYFSDFADLMNMDKKSKANSVYYIQEAIRKIKMRQLYNGAITLWDGEGTEHWWTTVYAAHFLLEAKKAGYDIDASMLDNTLEHLVYRLKNKQTIPYYYNGNQNKKIAPKEVAYSLYVLALAGKPQVSMMNYYKQNEQLLALDSRFLLSAAYALAGDRARFNELLPGSFAGEAAVKETGGSMASEIRDEAIALNALLEVQPDHPQVGIMAKHLSAQVKGKPYLSTQERAFTFLALGKIARKAAAADVKVTITSDGKRIAENDGTPLIISGKQLSGSDVKLEVSGQGNVYYFWQAEGISATGKIKEEDSYLKVRKRFFDRYGRPINGNTFSQNDLIVVQLSIEKTYNSTIENVVITDMLPAGFEIENPRTKEIPGMDWIKNQNTPTHMDIRDDRINMYMDVYTNPQTYYYAVRAVSPGTYVMGPVMADAMYNGEYHSYHGAGIIKVKGK